MTRKKYKEIVNQIEKELKANELKLERKNNKKETGISETNKERLSREEDERDDNFAMYGKYETNQEKILRIIKNKEFDREDRLLQKEEKESEYRISHLGPTFEELLELQRELEEKEREKNYKETGIKETDYERDQRESEEKEIEKNFKETGIKETDDDREQREYEEEIQKEEELEEEMIQKYGPIAESFVEDYKSGLIDKNKLEAQLWDMESKDMLYEDYIFDLLNSIEED